MIDSLFGAIAKLLPLVTVVGGAVVSSPKLKAEIAKVMQTTQVVATQQEVSDIAKMIYLDTIDGTQPKPEELAKYLAKSMKGSNGTSRDNSKDLWGQPYRLTYDKQRRELLVASAGPDAAFDTDDDIRGSYTY